jgi:hypothetical protein
LNFLEFFGPQTIFIGGCGMKFNFFRIIFEFFGPQMIKNDQIYIQMIKFVFKRSNSNLNGSIRRRHLIIAHRPQRREVSLGGSARPGSNMGDPAPTRALQPMPAGRQP